MQWIERLKMTHKLALVLAVPMLILGHLSLHRVMTAMEARHEAHHLGALARLGVAVGDMVHELQRERGASAGFLGSKGAKFQPELAAQRKRTDEKAAVLHTYLSGFDLEQYGADLQANLNEGLEHLGELQRIRSSVDGLNVPIGEVLEYYTDTNGHFLEVVPEMAKVSPNKDLAVATTAYAAFLQAKERAGIERAVLSNTFAANAFSPGMFEKFLKLVTTQDVYLAQFRALAAKPQLEFYDVTMKGEYVEETARMRKQAYEKAAGGGFGVDPVHWFKMQSGKIDLLKQVEDYLAQEEIARSDALASEATQALSVMVILAVGGFVMTLFIGIYMTRAINLQLGAEPTYLEEVSVRIAHGELDGALEGRDGHRTGVFAAIVKMRDDIRTQIEEEHRTAQHTARIKTALDSVSTSVMMADADYNIIYLNPAVEEMFNEAAEDLRVSIPGFDPTKLLGRNIDLFHRNPAHQRAVLDHMAATRSSEVKVGPRTFRIVANPVRSADGERIGTVVEWTDLTQQLEQEERERQYLEEERVMAAENTRIRNALDNASSRVMMTDNDGKVIYLNRSLKALFRDAQGDFRRDLPSFDAERVVGSSVDLFKTRTLASLRDLKAGAPTEVVLGGRTLSLMTNPVFTDEGERLGTALEWKDRTLEVAVEREVDAIVAAASKGDLSQRIDTAGKQGFFLQLGEGINSLVEVVEAALQDIAASMAAMAEGDLSRPITNSYSGAFGVVGTSVNTTIEKIVDIVGRLRRASEAIRGASDEIASGSTSLSRRTEHDAASLEETSASMSELTGSVRENAESARRAAQVSGTSRERAERGGEVVQRTVTAMSEIRASSKKIAEIVGVVDEIAFQTNLLALNASVEAARAGEQGRGFAVVATEVRHLASRSADAAREIKQLIKDSEGKVEVGADLVRTSGETLTEIVEGAKELAAIISEIASTSGEQATGIQQVNQAVGSMESASQQNAAMAEQTSAAAVELADRAKEMDELVRFFRSGQPRVASSSSRPRLVARA